MQRITEVIWTFFSILMLLVLLNSLRRRAISRRIIRDIARQHPAPAPAREREPDVTTERGYPRSCMFRVYRPAVVTVRLCKSESIARSLAAAGDQVITCNDGATWLVNMRPLRPGPPGPS